MAYNRWRGDVVAGLSGHRSPAAKPGDEKATGQVLRVVRIRTGIKMFGAVTVVALTLTGCGTSAMNARTTAKARTTTSTTTPARTSTTTTTTVPTTTTTVPKQEPWPSLVYTGPGVAVVGVSPGNGYQGTAPSRLYLSTDMIHWTNVTPPQSRVVQNGGYGYFDHASFLNPSIGWVAAWNGATTLVTLYRTSNGGKAWSAVSGGAHNIGDTLIQLLTPSTGYSETLQPSAPLMSLDVTTDAGKTWRTVYTGPQPTTTDGRYRGPFEMPIVFIDSRRAFGSPGDPPEVDEGPGDGDFFYSSDGASIWTRETPPLPKTAFACPSGAGETSSTSCNFAIPTFNGTERGVLPGIVVSDTHASVAFDVTSDGGRQWTLQSERTVTVAPVEPSDGGSNYPLVSVASQTSWWLVGWTAHGMTTQVSSDAGTSWAVNAVPALGGLPVTLAALNASDALLSIQDNGAGGTTGKVLVTSDGGRSWKPAEVGT